MKPATILYFSPPIVKGISTLKRLARNDCRETTADDLELLAFSIVQKISVGSFHLSRLCGRGRRLSGGRGRVPQKSALSRAWEPDISQRRGGF